MGAQPSGEGNGTPSSAPCSDTHSWGGTTCLSLSACHSQAVLPSQARGSNKAPSMMKQRTNAKWESHSSVKHTGSLWSDITSAIMQARVASREECHADRGKLSQLLLLVKLLEAPPANWSLKETTRRQVIAHMQPSNNANAPSLTEKHLRQLCMVRVCSKEPSLGQTQLLVMGCLFFRASSEENSYLALTLRLLITKGQKKKANPTSPRVFTQRQS